jgi:hypothetical protein
MVDPFIIFMNQVKKILDHPRSTYLDHPRSIYLIIGECCIPMSHPCPILHPVAAMPRSPHLWLSGGFHWTNAEGVAGLLWISRCTGRENFSKAVFRGPRFFHGEINGI